MPDTQAAHALDPHDLAAVKLLVGRPKDHALIRNLHAASLLKPEIVRDRLGLLMIPVDCMPKLLASFHSIFGP